MGSMIEAIKRSNPDEVYNLAASSFVSSAFEQPVANAEITGLAVTKLLDALRIHKDDVKFYQASSSEMYGNSNTKSQNEKTPFTPASPYAVSKLYAHGIADIYRKAYGMKIFSGILFNHESPLRGMEFVSRKISNAVAEISLGYRKELVLGNLNAKRDWGYAPEYMDAIHLIMQQKNAEDFVVSTNETHSVLEFVKLAFDTVGLNWEKHVKTNKRFHRPLDVEYLRGDNSKIKKKLKWKPKTTFKKLVKIMVEEDVRRWKMFSEGKTFPWDAPLYPNEDNIVTRKSKNSKKINVK